MSRIENCRHRDGCQCARDIDGDATADYITVMPDARLDINGVLLDTWPEPAKFVVHVGDHCLHFTVTSHASRPLKATEAPR